MIKCPKCGNEIVFIERLEGATIHHTFSYYGNIWNLENDRIVEVTGDRKLLCGECEYDCSGQLEEFDKQ